MGILRAGCLETIDPAGFVKECGQSIQLAFEFVEGRLRAF